MFHAFGKSFSGWKIFFGLFAIGILAGAGWFGWQVFHYYQAIKAGVADPLMEEQLQSTFSRAVANAHVTPQDLQHLYAKNAPSYGAADPKLTVVEFLDYDCPFCRAAYPGVREMMEKYKDQVRFIIRDFPVQELHPRALPSALAAHCAQDQGKFWPYFDALYVNQDHHEDADLEQYARNLGLDAKKFNACYENQDHAQDVQNDVHDALQVGVEGTPTFFFNGIKVQGALDRDQLDLLIQRFLAQTTTIH